MWGWLEEEDSSSSSIIIIVVFVFVVVIFVFVVNNKGDVSDVTSFIFLLEFCQVSTWPCSAQFVLCEEIPSESFLYRIWGHQQNFPVFIGIIPRYFCIALVDLFEPNGMGPQNVHVELRNPMCARYCFVVNSGVDKGRRKPSTKSPRDNFLDPQFTASTIKRTET